MNEPISAAELRHLAATRAPEGVKELLLEAAELTEHRLQAAQAVPQEPQKEATRALG